MGLSMRQFEVLLALLEEGPLTQRELSERLGFGLGTVNALVRECEAAGLIRDRGITELGCAALAPYRVDNAVILAAGLAERFVPISYEKPKGALVVRGEGLVERQIRQLKEAGIERILLVVGYKMEYFFALAEEEGVEIVVNEDYAKRNNNGSVWKVANDLANSYICSSDNYFPENPFRSHEYSAFYATQWVQGATDEWCVTTGPGHVITGVEIGGEDSLVMLGHAYFDRAFSARFREILSGVYNDPDTVDKLWEEIYVDNISGLRMVAREYPSGAVQEFDSLEELRHFDPDFIGNVDSGILDNIEALFGVSRESVGNFSPLKQGLTNLSCEFTIEDEKYVYRHPGPGTEKMLDRGAEESANLLAQDLGLDATYVHMDSESGWKISRYIPGARNADFSDDVQLRRAMEMSRQLHTSGAVIERDFDFVSEGLRYEKVLLERGPIDVPGYERLKNKVLRLKDYADADGFPLVPSHNDFFHLNFILDTDEKMHLIDWEYAGMSDQANDFGTLVVCSQLTPERAAAALEFYFGRPPTKREEQHFYAHVVFAGWAWYVWSLAKEAEGDHVGEWLRIYYRAAADNIDRLLNEYEASNSGSTNLEKAVAK